MLSGLASDRVPRAGAWLCGRYLPLVAPFVYRYSCGRTESIESGHNRISPYGTKWYRRTRRGRHCGWVRQIPKSSRRAASLLLYVRRCSRLQRYVGGSRSRTPARPESSGRLSIPRMSSDLRGSENAFIIGARLLGNRLGFLGKRARFVPKSDNPSTILAPISACE